MHFQVKLEENLNGKLSDWPVVNFKQITNPSFPELSNKTINHLSSNQNYAYHICLAVMTGSVDKDLKLLKVGELSQARWLSIDLLRYYMSVQSN